MQQTNSYIVSSPDAGKGLDKAFEIAQTALCTATSGRPCGVCRACRKVKQRIHPDLSVIEREEGQGGKPKQNISVEQIREIVHEAGIVPIEGQKKVYIIKEAQLMNIAAQNAALKLLEEPPEWVVMVLVTDNPDVLLPTVRSRCSRINLNSENSVFSEQTEKRCESYMKALVMGDRSEVFCAAMNLKLKTLAETEEFLQYIREYANDILCYRRKDPGLGRELLFKITLIADKCTAYIKSNVNPNHIAGLLAVLPFEDRIIEDDI